MSTQQRKLTKLFGSEYGQIHREEALENVCYRRMPNPEAAISGFSRRQMQEHSSDSVPARICGNCVHSGFRITRSRGISGLRWFCQNENSFTADQTYWTPQMFRSWKMWSEFMDGRPFARKKVSM